METDTEILTLLREIRDIEKQRLALHKQALLATDQALLEASKARETAHATQTRRARIQTMAFVLVVVLTIVALYVALR